MNQAVEMWNDRYSKNDYAYGSDPNVFFKNTLNEFDFNGKKILLPAEGEGRNAVFAAKNGLDVTAFDISIEGQKKAIKLAEQENVKIKYAVGNLNDLDIVNHKYDVSALIYAHFPPNIVHQYHNKIASLIEKDGIIILEGFSKNHLELQQQNPKVGGPKKIEMLFSVDSIKNDFPNFEILRLEEVEIELNEGEFHQGKGKVIRFIGQKVK